MKCDWCEEESETASFDPEWDAVVCDKCEEALQEEMKEVHRKEWETNGNKTAS